jgi:hypothetical protein
MRQTYIARLANLQAQIFAAPASESGQLIRQFLAHEAMNSRNLKKSTLLTPMLIQIIRNLLPRTLNGTSIYAYQYAISTIVSRSENIIILMIFNTKSQKLIYQKEVSLLPL